MALRQRRKRRNEAVRQKNLLGSALLTVAIAAAGGGVYLYATTPNEKIDEATFCRENGSDPVTAVILDTTDRISPVQREAILNEFLRLQDGLATFEKLDLYAVGHTQASVLEPLFSLCNPRQGSEIDPLYGNPKLVQRRWEEGFDRPLRNALDLMLEREEANSSPIIESIQSVVVTSLNRHSGGGLQRLIIASDMLQYSDIASHYREVPEFSDFRNSEKYDRAYSNMRGVSVNIWYIRRQGRESIQSRRHIAFWEQFFSSLGGSLTSVKRI